MIARPLMTTPTDAKMRSARVPVDERGQRLSLREASVLPDAGEGAGSHGSGLESPQARVGVGRVMADRLHRRLADLYAISELFARFENVHQTFDPALALVARTLPLRTAILVEVDDGSARTTVWSSGGQDPERLKASKTYV